MPHLLLRVLLDVIMCVWSCTIAVKLLDLSILDEHFSIEHNMYVDALSIRPSSQYDAMLMERDAA